MAAGGTSGQVLTKRSGTDYDTNWQTPATGGGSSLPAGGSTDFVLGKNSAADGDANWRNAGVPRGGSALMLLVKNSLTDFDSAWKTQTQAGFGTIAGFDTTDVVFSYNGGGEQIRAIPNVSGTFVPHASGDGNVKDFTLTGNTTFTNPSFAYTGTRATRFVMILRQDATGGRTVTWWPTLTWPGGTPTLVTTPGNVDVFSFVSVDGGATWYGWQEDGGGGGGGTPATSVTNSGVGNTAVVGTSTAYARQDHVHGREAFGPVTAQVNFSLGSTDGTATAVARSDHAHGTPANPLPGGGAAGTVLTKNSPTTGDASWLAPAVDLSGLHADLLGTKVWSSTQYVWPGGSAPDANAFTNIVFIDPSGLHDPKTSTGGRNVANDLWETGTVSGSSGGGGVLTVVTKTAAYTAAAGDVVLANATTANFTVTLPAATAGATVTVKKTDATGNVVTIAPAAGTIDGGSTLSIGLQYQSYDVVSDGTNWFVL